MKLTLKKLRKRIKNPGLDKYVTKLPMLGLQRKCGKALTNLQHTKIKVEVMFYPYWMRIIARFLKGKRNVQFWRKCFFGGSHLEHCSFDESFKEA